jgi:hypothetical protein
MFLAKVDFNLVALGPSYWLDITLKKTYYSLSPCNLEVLMRNSMKRIIPENLKVAQLLKKTPAFLNQKFY